MNDKVFLLWIDHQDTYELVGVYTDRILAEIDSLRIDPEIRLYYASIIIEEKELNIGKSLFLNDKIKIEIIEKDDKI